MKYAIDQIVDNNVVLENIETGEILNIHKKKLPNDIVEGNILVLKDGEFFLDYSEEEMRRQIIEEKMNRLKALKPNDKS